MGMSEISTWISVRRYDEIERDGAQPYTNLMRLSLSPTLTLEDLKSFVFYSIGVEQVESKVLKVRRQDNNLIPLSALLSGSPKEKPFIVDVVGVHQFCPAEKRTLPPGCVEALKSKLKNLEKRVVLAEAALPEITSSHLNTIEEAAAQLSNCVSFLDRRLDELSPPYRKQQIESTTTL